MHSWLAARLPAVDHLGNDGVVGGGGGGVAGRRPAAAQRPLGGRGSMEAHQGGGAGGVVGGQRAVRWAGAGAVLPLPVTHRTAACAAEPPPSPAGPTWKRFAFNTFSGTHAP